MVTYSRLVDWCNDAVLISECAAIYKVLYKEGRLIAVTEHAFGSLKWNICWRKVGEVININQGMNIKNEKKLGKAGNRAPVNDTPESAIRVKPHINHRLSSPLLNPHTWDICSTLTARLIVVNLEVFLLLWFEDLAESEHRTGTLVQVRVSPGARTLIAAKRRHLVNSPLMLKENELNHFYYNRNYNRNYYYNFYYII